MTTTTLTEATLKLKLRENRTEENTLTLICAFGMSRLPLIMAMMCENCTTQTNPKKAMCHFGSHSFFHFIFLFQFQKKMFTKNALREKKGKNKKKVENNFTVIFYKQKAHQNAIAYARKHARTYTHALTKMLRQVNLLYVRCAFALMYSTTQKQYDRKYLYFSLWALHESFRNCWRQFCRQISLNTRISSCIFFRNRNRQGVFLFFCFTSLFCCMCVSLKATQLK